VPGSSKSSTGVDQARLKAYAAPISSASGQPLSRTELIAKGNLICKRLNIRRNTTKVLTPLDYERSIRRSPATRWPAPAKC